MNAARWGIAGQAGLLAVVLDVAIRRALPVLILGGLLSLMPRLAAGAELVSAAELKSVQWREGRAVVEAEPDEAPAGTRLFVSCGARPVGLGRLVRAEAGEAVFEWAHAGSEGSAACDPNEVRAWFVPPDVVARSLARWPIGADLNTEVEAVGPGAASVWLRVGRNAGIQPEQEFMLSVRGQPVARLEARYVAAELTSARVVALVSDLRVRAGDVAVAWPSPAEREAGSLTSAVSFVEESRTGVVVWVPVSGGVDVPVEPHVDFFRDGEFVGQGRAERRDGRFWYVTYRGLAESAATQPASSTQPGEVAAAGRSAAVPALTTRPSDGTASAPSERGKAERAAALGGELRVRVGDRAVVRTTADVEGLRYVARVFERTANGALVNAGEADGLASGRELLVYRGGEALGTARVGVVEATYAGVTPVEEGVELRLGDELRFARPAEAPGVVGVVEEVGREGLFVARLMGTAAPMREPVALRAGGRVVGVAVLVVREGELVGGMVLAGSGVGAVGKGADILGRSSE